MKHGIFTFAMRLVSFKGSTGVEPGTLASETATLPTLLLRFSENRVKNLCINDYYIIQ